jgi:hypothetical protein
MCPRPGSAAFALGPSLLTCVIGLAFAFLASCKTLRDVKSCDELSYNTGERYTVTVLDLVPQRTTDGPVCVPLLVGDQFDVVVAADSDGELGCTRAATGEPVPEFIMPFAQKCEAHGTLGMSCQQADGRSIRTAIEGDPSIDAKVTAVLTVWWETNGSECQQSFDVRLESAASAP